MTGASHKLVTEPTFLAVDAGGTSTRAVVIDSVGRALGYGRAGSGNPTSAGAVEAVAALGLATERALAGLRLQAPSGAVAVLAGATDEAFVTLASARLATFGFARLQLQPDLLGMFHSGTPGPDGYAVVAGTGAVAGRVRAGALERVAGGAGWLLGDAGSGFWIGHQVARAVVAALDGHGPATALTDLVLDRTAISADAVTTDGGGTALRRFVTLGYSRRPVQLAEFAPLAFQALQDPVAHAIVAAAAAALTDLVLAVQAPDLAGPLVGGGSVLVEGLLQAAPDPQLRLRLPSTCGEIIPVADGLVGAAVLALRSGRIGVDQALFETLRDEVGRLRR